MNELAKDALFAHLFPKDFLDAPWLDFKRLLSLLLQVGAAIEYSYEFDSCKDYVASSFEDIQLVMMFTVGSKEEEQMRLRMGELSNYNLHAETILELYSSHV